MPLAANGSGNLERVKTGSLVFVSEPSLVTYFYFLYVIALQVEIYFGRQIVIYILPALKQNFVAFNGYNFARFVVHKILVPCTQNVCCQVFPYYPAYVRSFEAYFVFPGLYFFVLLHSLSALKSFDGLKTTTLRAGTNMVSPVFMFRAGFALRCFV